MGDPGAFITAKLAAMIGGFFGGAVILTFIKPKTIVEAFIRGGISVGSAIIFSDAILHFLNMQLSWDTQMATGAVVGFLAYSIIGLVVNFLVAIKHDSIIDVYDRVRGIRPLPPPVTKSTRKKAPPKKAAHLSKN